jgi:hypothetical protein
MAGLTFSVNSPSPQVSQQPMAAVYCGNRKSGQLKVDSYSTETTNIPHELKQSWARSHEEEKLMLSLSLSHTHTHTHTHTLTHSQAFCSYTFCAPHSWTAKPVQMLTVVSNISTGTSRLKKSQCVPVMNCAIPILSWTLTGHRRQWCKGYQPSLVIGRSTRSTFCHK